MNQISTTAELEKNQARMRQDAQPGLRIPASAAAQSKRYGWLSRLRSYFIFDPLIWAYTLILGTISLIVSFFDRKGRMQHNLARLWSWLIMKTIFYKKTNILYFIIINAFLTLEESNS